MTTTDDSDVSMSPATDRIADGFAPRF